MKRCIIYVALLSTVLFGAVFVSPTIESFNGGQVSPELEARVTFPKYTSSCRTIENMLVTVQGPVSRRPGTKYIADANSTARLIPFKISTDDSYVLEFGDGYLRFFRTDANNLGGQILE